MHVFSFCETVTFSKPRLQALQRLRIRERDIAPDVHRKAVGCRISAGAILFEHLGSNRILRAETLTVSFTKPWNSLAETMVAVRDTSDASLQSSKWRRRRELKLRWIFCQFSVSRAILRHHAVNRGHSEVRFQWAVRWMSHDGAPRNTKITNLLSRPVPSKRGEGGAVLSRGDVGVMDRPWKIFLKKGSTSGMKSETQSLT